MSTYTIASGLSFWDGLNVAQQLEVIQALHAARDAQSEQHRAIAAMSTDELRAALRPNRCSPGDCRCFDVITCEAARTKSK